MKLWDVLSIVPANVKHRAPGQFWPLVAYVTSDKPSPAPPNGRDTRGWRTWIGCKRRKGMASHYAGALAVRPADPHAHLTSAAPIHHCQVLAWGKDRGFWSLGPLVWSEVNGCEKYRGDRSRRDSSSIRKTDEQTGWSLNRLERYLRVSHYLDSSLSLLLRRPIVSQGIPSKCLHPRSHPPDILHAHKRP